MRQMKEIRKAFISENPDTDIFFDINPDTDTVTLIYQDQYQLKGNDWFQLFLQKTQEQGFKACILNESAYKHNRQCSKHGLKDIIEISPQIYLLNYATQKELCQAFLRLEEHYESPEFKGQIFTLGQYREWYAKQNGSFSYYSDWSGFNVPHYAFKAFNAGLFDPLTESEQEVINLFKGKTDFCVIGTYTGSDPDIYEHEISHAMFATMPEYQAEVLKALEGQDLKDLSERIIKMGYNESVVLDECHAYIGESSDYLNEKGIAYPVELIGILKEIKAKYRGGIK